MAAEELTIPQKVAKFIRDKRLARGETQKEFAIYLFNDANKQGWIAKIEGGRGITLETLEKILHRLNCELEIIEH